MKGLELAENFYNEYKYSLLKEDAPEWSRMAVGLVGHGSECFGFDDEISRDHDYESGFCVWLTEEDENAFGFSLMRAYMRLPEEYQGVKREVKNVFGSEYRGIKTINEFYSYYLPFGKVPETNAEWLAVPDFYLAEATNGKVFYDGLGEFTRIRKALLSRPEDVRLKKLASELFYAAQTGQYNYSRCLRHGEKGAASIALNEFATHVLHAVYLINHSYAPYYKWLFKGVEKLPRLGFLKEKLEKTLADPYASENASSIEEICADICAELSADGLSVGGGTFLESHAYNVVAHIKDGELRNSPIML